MDRAVENRFRHAPQKNLPKAEFFSGAPNAGGNGLGAAQKSAKKERSLIPPDSCQPRARRAKRVAASEFVFRLGWAPTRELPRQSCI